MNEGEAGKICGTVNAKNGFGAYTGKQLFFAGYVHQGDGYQIFAFNVPGDSLEQAVFTVRSASLFLFAHDETRREGVVHPADLKAE